MKKEKLKKQLKVFIKQYEKQVALYYKENEKTKGDSHIENTIYCINKMLVCIESHIDSL